MKIMLNYYKCCITQTLQVIYKGLKPKPQNTITLNLIFKCLAKLANESTPLLFLLSVSSSMSLSFACCHGDMTRKQRRSDETE